jgi:hypothetical protein
MSWLITALIILLSSLPVDFSTPHLSRGVAGTGFLKVPADVASFTTSGRWFQFSTTLWLKQTLF